ncbi:OsmC family protein [Solwaraspora sp. WMMD1047]|uniref:OsmC family protein n=1 Tax=Solwaraspora sp. WMMD1047 TaxID=3016102 RepID=UPI0024169305|nr:OsmC family protein [Solwaraspora sp. WMMD1047]MDG4832047.1 OsmC family protein [Solwaraspora sp. WMMD1047]
MTNLVHHYRTVVTWTGNRGTGTSGYRDYDRTHEVAAEGRPVIPGSSDPAFRGDPDRWTPEHLLLAALSQCHMLSYLHLCAVNGVTVTHYVDHADGSMRQVGPGGHFTEVVLRPQITVQNPDQIATATALHPEAHNRCFIAASVNFPVRHEPLIEVAGS